eukprot:gnl/TRDRNA2_/TRDRNA2_164101_c1_seq2.p1 gnl/TRDRNA2_/TRDRNA2_164101_c1~~gnl/TRDRNA2_/TRDRNA2_164101_c1_seq2.p1  ORF type:complete len:174 (-),score=43.72 gnl/TRDRNA2_/TRDRNA2_164101_c1_seq2:22-543(-)
MIASRIYEAGKSAGGAVERAEAKIQEAEAAAAAAEKAAYNAAVAKLQGGSVERHQAAVKVEELVFLAAAEAVIVAEQSAEDAVGVATRQERLAAEAADQLIEAQNAIQSAAAATQNMAKLVVPASRPPEGTELFSQNLPGSAVSAALLCTVVGATVAFASHKGHGGDLPLLDT